MIITVSGMPGAGSSTAARLLAKRLGLRFFSVGEYTKELAREMADEESSSKRITKFWEDERGRSRSLHEESEATARRRAEQGDVVVEGKLQIHMLKDLSDAAVWLKASVDVRAKRYSQRDKMSGEESSEVLRKKESQERENWQLIYGFDYFDQEKEADIVVDTSDKTPQEIVDIIIGAIKRSEKGESKKKEERGS